jgi:hypothetical protein
MVDALTFFAAGTLLFFFWAYGIYAFGRDLKNKWIPLVRRYRQGRRNQREEERKRQEREEKEQQLF